MLSFWRMCLRFPLLRSSLILILHSEFWQKPHPLDPTTACRPPLYGPPSVFFFYFSQWGAGTHYWLQYGGGIELAQGGLSMWACVNLLVGCKCIIFHNQPAVWCTRENEAAVALQMERRLAGENIFAVFFVFFFWAIDRLKLREWKIKEKEERLRLHLCVSVSYYSSQFLDIRCMIFFF